MDGFSAAHVPSIVLVAPKEAGTVGAAARAMKNMGLSDLRLVAPRCELKHAFGMAAHAADLLEAAQLFDDLGEAVAGCELVVGATARARRDHAPAVLPEEMAKEVGRVSRSALVFGREESGLTNAELDVCNLTVTISAHPDYPVLNLAQAVLLLSYELFRSRGAVALLEAQESKTLEQPQWAPRERVEAMYAHLHTLMLEVGFTDAQRGDHTMRLFRRMFDRIRLDERELALWRGLIAQSLWAARRAKGEAPNTTPWPNEQDAPEGSDGLSSSGRADGC